MDDDLTDRERAELIAARVLEKVDVSHDAIMLLAAQYLVIDQRLHDVESM